MLTYFGEQLLKKMPEPCQSSGLALCPEHGFSMPSERANFIIDEMMEHAKSCYNKHDYSFDFPRMLGGPGSIDLLSPTEVFYAGFIVRGIIDCAIDWYEQQASLAHRTTLEQLAAKVSSFDRKGWTVVVGAEGVSELPQAVRDWLTKMGYPQQPTKNKADDGS